MKTNLMLCGATIAIAIAFIAAAQTHAGKSKADSSDDLALRDKLTPLQYEVTKEEGTEPPFKNEYWDNKKEGIYVCIISGEALFSSQDKFDSGTGWPSFTKPLNATAIEEKTDSTLGSSRTEVRSIKGNSHLGHVFKDGPPPTGLRYCMNSAALRFVSAENLEKEGYIKYRSLFAKSPGHGSAMTTERAVLGAGCFWCVEEIYESVPGVIHVVSGYAGGTQRNPTYHEVGSGKTGHAEVVEIEYDPAKISYRKLIDIFWETHDPTDGRGVSPDFGSQYRSIILPRDEAQRKAAEKSKADAQTRFTKPIATEIKPLETFYPAEDYHQDYARKHPDDPYVQNISQPRFKKVNISAILAKP